MCREHCLHFTNSVESSKIRIHRKISNPDSAFLKSRFRIVWISDNPDFPNVKIETRANSRLQRRHSETSYIFVFNRKRDCHGTKMYVPLPPPPPRQGLYFLLLLYITVIARPYYYILNIFHIIVYGVYLYIIVIGTAGFIWKSFQPSIAHLSPRRPPYGNCSVRRSNKNYQNFHTRNYAQRRRINERRAWVCVCTADVFIDVWCQSYGIANSRKKIWREKLLSLYLLKQ